MPIDVYTMSHACGLLQTFNARFFVLSTRPPAAPEDSDYGKAIQVDYALSISHALAFRGGIPHQ